MANRSRSLVPDEELFMSRPAEDCDSPTVEPLRIFKPQSPKPATDRFKYPTPPSASGVTSNPTSSSAAAARPVFPLPPGASSSANPLPYPVDDDQIIPPAVSSRPPYPDDRPANSNGASRPQVSTSYATSYHDTTARIGLSPSAEKKPGLAERRGGAVPPSLSPSSPVDSDDLFAKPLNNQPAQKISTSYQNKPYYPPPAGSTSVAYSAPIPAPSAVPVTSSAPAPLPVITTSAAALPTHPALAHPAFRPDPDLDTLKMPVAVNGDSGMNRFASTASTSTTRASRGSPPPPETPIVGPGNNQGNVPGGGIEARYAAAGISGTATLNSLQAPSSAASQRLAQYGGQPPAAAVAPATRPWTPTESPENQPHGPPTVYQGLNPVQSPPPSTSVSPPPVPAQPPTTSSMAGHPALTSAHNVGHPALAANHSGSSNNSGSIQTATPQQSNLQVSVLEQDFQRMQASTPPPAYTSVNPNGSSSYPSEKQQPQQQQQQPPQQQHAFQQQAAPVTTAAPIPAQQHPVASTSAVPVAAAAVAGAAAAAAVAVYPSDDKKQQLGMNAAGSAPHNAGHPALAHTDSMAVNGLPGGLSHTPSVATLSGPASPPPLPEGWISHLDQNSGQYYYIHLASQATQWEFPKGPTPLHHDPTPLSPAASTYGNPLASPFAKPALASPMYPPTPGYAESITSLAASTATTGFMGPPPSAGVDMYKIAPTNGVYFGPYMRYVNMNVEKGVWLGSIMIVSDSPQPPTIHIHLSIDLSPNPRQLIPHVIYTHQRWTFYKYDMDLPMGENGTERWTYAVTSHLGCTRYEFVVAGRHEQGWRFIAHSGNDFSPMTSQAERNKLGGVDLMWKDVLQKNVECGGFHVQLGLGDQMFGDRLWREVPLLQQWLAISGRENRKNVQWTARHEEDVTHAYFHYYTSHFDQPFIREAFAQIPHVLQANDHEIFDGFGSYPDYMQQTSIFKNIGRVAIEMYLLFQHHTTIEVLRNVQNDRDLFTITGAGWHFVKYLGPAMVVVGPDCRSERTQTRVMAGPTYQGLFPKVALLPPSVQHCIWMISVPVVYPRMETVETLANTFQTGKKAVNTTYNILGKVTSSVAGVVGGKEVVQQGFSTVKKAIGKSGLMGNMLNNFGEFGITEELRDLWTHESKDLERTYLIRTLQGIAQQKGIRMTFLSGGLVHDPTHPSDHKTMYQIISSPIVGAPANTYMLKMLHNNRLLYVPQNGHLSNHEVSDTKEDMMEIFQVDATGAPREHKKLMNRRNYVTVVAYDAEALSGSTYAASVANGQQGLSKLSLAVDYVVQAGDGGFNAPTKYGPVIVPHLEYGH